MNVFFDLKSSVFFMQAESIRLKGINIGSPIGL